LESEYEVIKKEFDNMMLTVPNTVLHPNAPVGKDDSENIVMKTINEVPKFDFTPLDHMELMKKHDMVDLER